MPTHNTTSSPSTQTHSHIVSPHHATPVPSSQLVPPSVETEATAVTTTDSFSSYMVNHITSTVQDG